MYGVILTYQDIKVIPFLSFLDQIILLMQLFIEVYEYKLANLLIGFPYNLNAYLRRIIAKIGIRMTTGYLSTIIKRSISRSNCFNNY